MNTRPRLAMLTLLGAVAIPSTASAQIVSYTFAGILNGFGSQAYTGILTIDTEAPHVTEYWTGDIEGFSTVYEGALIELSINVNGQIVSKQGGDLNVLNIDSADYSISPGLDFLTFPLRGGGFGATGSIDGTIISNIYLSFYDRDGYIDTSDTLPGGWNGDSGIDPSHTGTAIPTLPYGEYFLGLNFGVTNTVNTISSFSPGAPVPEANTWLMLLAGLGSLKLMRMRRRGSA